MRLKQYQLDTLDILRRYLEEAHIAGPAAAYTNVTGDPEQKKRLGLYGGQYKPLAGSPDAPHVCLRLPTGGGKTILGAHSIAVARDAWIEKDYPLVLWLTPTTIIRTQTADALKNPAHPYRRALDNAFEGRVRVFNSADFRLIRPQDIENNLCVVVATMQTFRIEDTEGRKVYAHNENMEPHYSNIAPSAPGLDLERHTEGLNKGDIKFSFANLLHIHRPLMILDEAHNFVSELSDEVKRRINPCAVIEFTATPRLQNNTLHNVTAQELKQAEMIKLPIVLARHESWEAAVSGAVASRASLAETAKFDKDFIRPIVLFQAQKKNQNVTVDVLKKHLIETEQIPPERIAVATGEQRELDGVNLFDPACPVEYVITKEALKEGWDCSFAYVFCSLAQIQSKGEVEQLLGRVLRMPYAKRRKKDDLNRAYAHVSELSFQDAASALVDRLVAIGFDKEDADQSVEFSQLGLEGAKLFGLRDSAKPVFETVIESVSDEERDALKALSGIGVEMAEKSDGGIVLKSAAGLKPAAAEALSSVLSEKTRGRVVKAVEAYREQHKEILSPSERGKKFRVPRLSVRLQDIIIFPDKDNLLGETGGWTPLAYPPRLDKNEFDPGLTPDMLEIDLKDNRLRAGYLGQEGQLDLGVKVEGWNEENLTLWLDKQVRQIDLRQPVVIKWVRDLVDYLTKQRELDITLLTLRKYALARKIKEKFNQFRRDAMKKAYQRYLLDGGAELSVTFDDGFEFFDAMYDDQRWRRGSIKFDKHFLGPDRVPALGDDDKGEEVACAWELDRLESVEYWVRNVARHPNSFRLPTATDNFYPDFIAKLDDGRLLVVEYKGAHLSDASDANEKRTIGALWEKEGGGVFIMAEKEKDGKDVRQQLKERIST